MDHEESPSLRPQLFLSPRDFFDELVDEGLSRRNIKTYPAVQTYLVGLLEHYLDSRNLFEEEIDELGQRKHPTLAEMYMKANLVEKVERAELLKKLADKTLYISGFFGDSLQRKLVDIDYYAQMGGSAYASLAGCIREDTLSAVYRTFSQRFGEFVDVLTFISQKSMIQSDENLLRLYERYLKTGSEMARERLLEMGVINMGPDARSAKQD